MQHHDPHPFLNSLQLLLLTRPAYQTAMDATLLAVSASLAHSLRKSGQYYLLQPQDIYFEIAKAQVFDSEIYFSIYTFCSASYFETLQAGIHSHW